MTTDNAEGALLGLACGDALGRPVEFKSSKAIQKEYGTLTEMVGGGTWNKPAGTVTDDTDQMLCIARSLVENREFVPEDVARRFVNWYESGPFDIGNMTRDALSRLRGDEDSWREVGKQVYEDLKTQPNAGAGNGSIMRCAPIAIAYRDDTESLVESSIDSSWITHADPRCTYGCALLNRTIAELIDSDEELEEAIEVCRERSDGEPGVEELLESVEGVRELELQEVSGTGYVVDTLQASLYYALTAESFESAVVNAVNGGGDTDTVGAVTGALAGARFGASDIPERWTDEIDESDEISRLSKNLFQDSFAEYG